jgi:hypothetical protein
MPGSVGLEPRREANLGFLTNNTRFLVLPWVTVPHLASHLLATLARRVRDDWQAKYGHPVHALETFVDRDRFKGTCYRAANWLRLGSTQGRTRNDRNHCLRATVKDVYLARLSRALAGASAPADCSRARVSARGNNQTRLSRVMPSPLPPSVVEG